MTMITRRMTKMRHPAMIAMNTAGDILMPALIRNCGEGERRKEDQKHVAHLGKSHSKEKTLYIQERKGIKENESERVPDAT
jgi:hypothetical protein